MVVRMAAVSILGNCKLVAFAPTTDPERARVFYEGVLGLRLVADEKPFALVFDANGVMTTRQPLALTFHSYAYALVRREFVLAGDVPPTLLSGPEQRRRSAGCSAGEAAGGEPAAAEPWPERLRAALGTRGFATELRDFLLRRGRRGLDGHALARLGRQRDRDDWVAAGAFLARYDARFDLAPVPAYDYAEIIRIAAALLSRGAVRERERKAYDVVLVDEYQDTDPAQEALLHALAGDGRELIVVGDPDQAIYAFRGADVSAIMRFPERFRTPDDRPARVIALGTCRRSGTVLLAASRRIAARLPAPPAAVPGPRRTASPHDGQPDGGQPGAVARRRPAPSRPAPGRPAAGRPSRSAAAALRPGRHDPGRGRLQRQPGGHRGGRCAPPGPPARRRALVVHGGPGQIGDRPGATAAQGARRDRGALGDRRRRAAAGGRARGAPAAPAAALRAAVWRPSTRRPRSNCSPGRSAAPTRWACAGSAGRCGRPHAARARTARRSRWPPPCVDPRELTLIRGPAADAARRVAAAGAGLAHCQGTTADGAAHDVLWAVWHASGLAPAWQAVSAAGAPAVPRPTATWTPVCALFDAAARFTSGCRPARPRCSWTACPARRSRATPSPTTPRTAMRSAILTAHRAKGLEWDVVVVAGVQEGISPDLRMRVLAARHGRTGSTRWARRPAAGRPDPVTRRPRRWCPSSSMRNACCSTRRRPWARHVLVVTAACGEDSEDRPSRFLAELAGDDVEIEPVASAGGTWLSLPALTAELRHAAADPGLPAGGQGPPPRPSWPGSPRPGSAARTRGSGTR